ncbi:MAG: hypothetical protein AB1491_11585 [Thermodesulfobacteriota bacterium]
MGWRTEWKAISDRIEGLLEAGRIFAQLEGKDSFGALKKELLPHARIIYSLIMEYKKTYEQYIPEKVIGSIQRFENHHNVFTSQDSDLLDEGKLKMFLPCLASFRAEFNYLLSDIQAVAKRITERAFIHLQRLIIADNDIQKRWIEAFEKGEPACEKLGAAHLLLHGIWAFKAQAKGEQTDLIMGEPIKDLSQVESAAEALVLTEWKKVSKPKELTAKAEEAFKQASIYGNSLLAGIELAGYRYLVFVSEGRLDLPSNRIENEITYRHINIPVKPSVPSKTHKAKASPKS